MIAITSKMAYKQINEDGTSSTQKNVIMETIKGYCNMEHYDGKGVSLRELKQLTGFDINAVSGRVNDLKKEGLIVTTHKRKCTISGRPIAPVILKSETDVFNKEIINKITLLLKLYGYKDYEFELRSNGTFSLMIGYYKSISENDLIKIQVNSNSKLIQHSFYDDDCGYKFWYELQLKGE